MGGIFDAKKIERQFRKGLSSILIDKQKDTLREDVDRVLERIYRTASSTRHRARKSDPVGKFSSYGVPVDTGNLQRSIKKIPVTVVNGHYIGKVIQDSSIAPYGMFVEYGHGIRPAGSPYKGKKEGGYIGWVPPQSFMRSALYKHKDEIKALMRN